MILPTHSRLYPIPRTFYKVKNEPTEGMLKSTFLAVVYTPPPIARSFYWINGQCTQSMLAVWEILSSLISSTDLNKSTACFRLWNKNAATNIINLWGQNLPSPLTLSDILRLNPNQNATAYPMTQLCLPLNFCDKHFFYFVNRHNNKLECFSQPCPMFVGKARSLL